MNRYGSQAQTYMRENQPEAWNLIADPHTHFTQLGEQMATQIDKLTEQAAGLDCHGEPTLDRLGRRVQARLAAESAILTATLRLETKNVS